MLEILSNQSSLMCQNGATTKQDWSPASSNERIYTSPRGGTKTRISSSSCSQVMFSPPSRSDINRCNVCAADSSSKKLVPLIVATSFEGLIAWSPMVSWTFVFVLLHAPKRIMKVNNQHLLHRKLCLIGAYPNPSHKSSPVLGMKKCLDHQNLNPTDALQSSRS